ncbi:uncharacterized protein L201_005459 [Kwoniella dendrophila CBS 6074]|uniref:Response regulatory domain-containing protein n=1 Tax=Kwoniella dendrophila CBS 6074 TaxID=1295534 RepID=A0AAX4K1A4_9TREE
MSRIPSGPPYPHQIPPQSAAAAGYYGNPSLSGNPLPPVMQHQGLPPPPPPPGTGTPYASDPNLYPYDRHPQSLSHPGGPWSNSGPMPGPGPPPHPSAMPLEMYQNNPAAGPSSSRTTSAGDPYQAYAQPLRSSPGQNLPSSRQPSIQKLNANANAAWSSVHPISSGASTPGRVKLEDLVSTSDRRPTPTSIPILPPVPSNTPQSNIAIAVTENNKRPGTSGNDGAGSSGNTAAAGGGSGNAAGGTQQGPSEFIKKLYKMLEEESVAFGKGKAAGQPRDKGGKRGSVGWGRGGTTFVVWDMNDFTTKVLPQTFRHSNFSSFVRQLNKYGFSKIKHVDEESGTIKENVWEFQHPSFQAGGKSDLENIKRKAVAPRKTAGGEGEDTSPKAFGLSAEDASRINLMENRIVSLEGNLERALEEVREARARESGMMGVLKEVIGHLAASERATSGSPMSDGNYSPRILHLFKAFDSIPQPGSRSTPSTGYGAPISALPYSSQFTGQIAMAPAPTFNPLYVNGGTAQTSPRTDGTASRGSRGSMSGPTSGGGMRGVSGAPSRLGSLSGPSIVPPAAQVPTTIIPPTAVPLSTATQPQPDLVPKEEITENQAEMPTLFSGEPLSMTPMFAETPAWLTEGNQSTLPMYHRKSSDGSTLRMMYDALSGGTVPNAAGRFAEEVNGTSGATNGLESINEQETVNSAAPLDQQQQATQIVDIVMAPPGGFESADLSDIQGKSAVSVNAPSSSSLTASVNDQQNGGIVSVPAATTTSTSPSSGTTSKFKKHTNGNSALTIKPHWATTPKILVVEDDLVYRQLSSRFLSKFGCVTETVENAQGAIEKMNKDKYDLVLMDIFFGPNMDGRKATSLIRQFDNYTPIISMTSNAQPQDVDSYIRSGMNDILAKPFTKHGLFLILDKHLMHLRQAQIYEKIIPISVGVPPLSDQHVQEALAISAATIQGQGTAGLLMGLNGDANGIGGANIINDGEGGADGEHDDVVMRNPLAGSGWSDETYQLVLQQFLATGMMPDVNSLSNGSIGTGIIFSDASTFNLNPPNNRKRSIEALNDDAWEQSQLQQQQQQQQQQINGNLNGQQQQAGLGVVPGFGMVNGITIGFVPSGSTLMTHNPTMMSNDGSERDPKRPRGVVG